MGDHAFAAAGKVADSPHLSGKTSSHLSRLALAIEGVLALTPFSGESLKIQGAAAAA